MTSKAKAKKAAFKPVPVAVQIRRHHRAVEAAKKSAAFAKAHPGVAKARHAAAVKAAKARKKAKKHGAPLNPDDVPCCVAQAVAESRRLALGVPVAVEDVLALHWAAGGDPTDGARVVDVLTAARDLFGLAAFRPADESHCGPLILGLDVPGGAHAVLATPDGWWSWSELHWPQPGAVLTEAWAVTW